MSWLKYVLAAAAVAGLAGFFLLPLFDGVAATLWDVRHSSMLGTLSILVAFAAAGAVSVAGIVRPPFERWQAQISFGAFVFVAIKFVRSFADALSHLGIGGYVVGAAALVGSLAAVAGILRPSAPASGGVPL